MAKAKAKPKISEADIQKSIIKYLSLKGIFHWRQNTQGQLMQGSGNQAFIKPSSAPGAPDVIGVLPDGRALFIEVKTPSWRPPSPEAVETTYARYMRGEIKSDYHKTFRDQRSFQIRARRAGGLVIVATSLEDVSSRIDSYLQAFTQGVPDVVGNYCKTIDDYYSSPQGE